MRIWIVPFLAISAFLGLDTASAHVSRHHAKTIYQTVHPSIYPVYVVAKKNKRLNSVGSSVAITPSTLVTNCHVLHAGSHFIIESGGKQYPANVLRGSKYRDICLLKVKGLTLNPVSIRLSETVPVGEPVYALGNPKGSIKSITTGIISNKMPVEGGIWLQTDATISFGSSGGGLFDDQGKLIGITTALKGRFGYALPTEWVVAQLNSADQVKNNRAFFANKSKPMIKELAVTQAGSLYQYMHGNCFALIHGKNWLGQKRGSLFWSSAEPGLVLLFPNTGQVNDVLTIVEHVLKSGPERKQNMQRGKSWITLNGKHYALYTLQEKKGLYPLLIGQVGEHFLQSLQSQSGVSARIRDRYFNKGKISYSLRELKPFLLGNGTRCRQGVQLRHLAP
jgi:S1-C subfamily serine protease